MMKKFTFLITALIFVLNTNAQNDLWPNEPVNTGSNATYLINSATFNSDNLLYGKIGAFFINDLGNYQCGGWQAWSGSSTQIAVWADDSTTPEKDGFETGEEIIWLGTNDNGTTTYEASVTYVQFMGQLGSSYFTANSVNVISPFAISNTQFCVNDADSDGICDENETSGCTDPTAFNYNPDAEVNDGSCLEVVLGCTNQNADNYNSLANTDDGSCTVTGCMNELAQNYNELATTDDGSCIIDGCSDPLAFNYNANATVNDGSCLDAIDLSYDTVPTSTSTNFNILANTISLTLANSAINTEDIIGAFQIINGELVCVGYNPWEEGDMAISLWLDDPLTEVEDGYVTNEPIYWIANQNSTGMNYLLEVSINEFDIITNINVNLNVNLGCSDENAFNYTEGVIEDGSCVPIINGCIDENSCGYDASANTDDGSCYTLNVEISISETNVLTADVTATTENVLNNPQYNWTLDGIPNGLSQSELTIFNDGSYEVTVTDDSLCQVTSDSLIAYMTTNEIIINKIFIYPNPVNSLINITSNNTDIYSFNLYNAIGELVISKSNINSKAISINRNELNSGIYISKITDANGNSVVRNIIFE